MASSETNNFLLHVSIEKLITSDAEMSGEYFLLKLSHTDSIPQYLCAQCLYIKNFVTWYLYAEHCVCFWQDVSIEPRYMYSWLQAGWSSSSSDITCS